MSGEEKDAMTECLRQRFQTLLVEIPHAPCRSGFGYGASGSLDPPLPSSPGRKQPAPNCLPFCMMSPLRMEHSHRRPL